MRNRSTTSVAGAAALILLCGSVFVLRARAQDAVPAKPDQAVQAAREAAEDQRAKAEAEVRAAEAQLQASRAALIDAQRAHDEALRGRRAAYRDEHVKAETALRSQRRAIQAERAGSDRAVTRIRRSAIRAENDAAEIAVEPVLEPAIAARARVQDAQRVAAVLQSQKAVIAQSRADLARRRDVVAALQSRRAVTVLEPQRAAIVQQLAVQDAELASRRALLQSIQSRAATSIRQKPGQPAVATQIPLEAPTAIAGQAASPVQVPAEPITPQRRRLTPAVPSAPAPLTRSTPLAEPVQPLRGRRPGTLDLPMTPMAPSPWNSRVRTLAPAHPGSGRILEDELDRLELERINLQASIRRNRDRDESRGIQERLDTVRWKMREIEKALDRKRARLRGSRASNPAGDRLGYLQQKREEFLTRYDETHPAVQAINREINEVRKSEIPREP